LPDGTIELLGRADNQVKVRGFRIELGEIEVVLSQLDGVVAAVVVAREDSPGNQRLVAYFQPEMGATISPAALRRGLKQRLPSYMVPAMFVALDEFPLTPTGKIDRRALPAPEQQRASIDERFVAPQSPTEQVVARIWSNALCIDRIGVYDNYFDLGGDSLRLVEALAAIEEQIGVRLNPAYAQTQTLGQIASICDEMVARGEVRAQKPASRSGSVVRAMRRMLGAGSRQEAR
jgi:acyl carrier protein